MTEVLRVSLSDSTVPHVWLFGVVEYPLGGLTPNPTISYNQQVREKNGTVKVLRVSTYHHRHRNLTLNSRYLGNTESLGYYPGNYRSPYCNAKNPIVRVYLNHFDNNRKKEGQRSVLSLLRENNVSLWRCVS